MVINPVCQNRILKLVCLEYNPSSPVQVFQPGSHEKSEEKQLTDHPGKFFKKVTSTQTAALKVDIRFQEDV